LFRQFRALHFPAATTIFYSTTTDTATSSANKVGAKSCDFPTEEIILLKSLILPLSFSKMANFSQKFMFLEEDF